MYNRVKWDSSGAGDVVESHDCLRAVAACVQVWSMFVTLVEATRATMITRVTRCFYQGSLKFLNLWGFWLRWYQHSWGGGDGTSVLLQKGYHVLNCCVPTHKSKYLYGEWGVSSIKVLHFQVYLTRLKKT